MNDKDDIKELFQRELGNHQVQVNPQLWKGIQGQLANSAAGSAGSSIVAVKSAVSIKIAVSVILTAAALGTYFVVTTSSDIEKSVNEKSKTASIVEKNTHEDGVNQLSDEESVITTNEADTSEERFIDITMQVEIQETIIETIALPEELQAPMVPGSDPLFDLNEERLIPDETESLEHEIVISPLEVTVEYTKHSNQHYSFQALSTDAEKIVWDFGDGLTYTGTEAEHIFTESGTFDVVATAFKNGQSKTSSVTVTIDVVGKITLLPTFFTPNGDGSNDEFFIQSEGLHDFSIVILDESGGILFESNDINFTWDGRDRTSGIIAEPGIYFYIITAKDDLGNTISKHQRLQLKQ
ncbi:MAG: gliding motility-associated C-terminal domain-containing protein [Crocinitomicaceae bacterium]|nr:gliding motility-associated C-terminal domain-containing protein [Crocinitomicaceae bacterium]